ncbi:MAG: cytochrome b N-terminal domain-containing protein [Pirellulales bacterium]
MKTFLEWLDDRTGCRHLMHEALYERIPGGARWRYVWGSTLSFVFVAQVITGMFLWMAYSPSAQTAWESVYYIQHVMPGGWLLRGLHHFFSQAMVVLLALHLMQVVIDGAYRAPREVNFWLGLVLMLLVLSLSLTGYLLPWDQKGYWATRVATNLLSVVPLVGPQLQQLVVGGPDYGHHTLTRFFALHAGVLPGLLVVFLAMHIAIFRRHGLCAKLPLKGPEASFWPDQLLKDAVASLAVLVVVLILVVHPVRTFFSADSGPVELSALGAELGAPADPSNQFAAARPEWYFLFLFQFLKLFEGWGATGELIGAIGVPTLVLVIMCLMPVLGRWKLGHGFNVAFTLAILGGAALLTAAALNEDYRAKWTDGAAFAEVQKTIDEIGSDEEKIAAHFDNDAGKMQAYRAQLKEFEKYRKSQEYLASVAAAESEAHRAVALASSQDGIPYAGAVALLRGDPKTQGPKLFARYCASCHAFHDGDEQMAPSEATTAPNLYGFASREWIAGLLDPKKIAGPEYFGHTAHSEGEMVTFVNDTLVSWEPGDARNAVLALSAEAQLPGQAAADQQDAAAIEAGRKVIENEEHCASCHKFRDVGELGSAPDLTGYGSREWLLGMIANPNHERFYGDNNDRMPAFAEHGGDAPQNMLSQQQLGLIVDWLRGRWYEPPSPVESAKKTDESKAEAATAQ